MPRPKKTPATKVIYRHIAGEVFALFPELPANAVGSECVVYGHSSQHGSASPAFAMAFSAPVSASRQIAVDALAEELREQGYTNLEVCQRISERMHRTRRANAKAIEEMKK